MLLSVTPSTNPLEFSSSKLCYEERNDLKVSKMEVLYILSAINNHDIALDAILSRLEKYKF